MTHLIKCVSFSLILISLMGFVMVAIMMGAAPELFITGVTPDRLYSDDTTRTVAITGPNLKNVDLFTINGNNYIDRIKSRESTRFMVDMPGDLACGEHTIVVGQRGVLSKPKPFYIKRNQVYYEQFVSVGETITLPDSTWDDIPVVLKEVDLANNKAVFASRGPDAIERLTEISMERGGRIQTNNSRDELYVDIPEIKWEEVHTKYLLRFGANKELLPFVTTKSYDSIVIQNGHGEYIAPDKSMLEFRATPDFPFPKVLALQGVDPKRGIVAFMFQNGTYQECVPGDSIRDVAGEYVIYISGFEWDFRARSGSTRMTITHTPRAQLYKNAGLHRLERDVDALVLRDEEISNAPEAAMQFLGIDTLTGGARMRCFIGGSRTEDERVLVIGDWNSYIAANGKRAWVKNHEPLADAIDMVVEYEPKDIPVAPGSVRLHKNDVLRTEPDAFLKVAELRHEDKTLLLEEHRNGVLVRNLRVPEGCAIRLFDDAAGNGMLLAHKSMFDQYTADVDLVLVTQAITRTLTPPWKSQFVEYPERSAEDAVGFELDLSVLAAYAGDKYVVTPDDIRILYRDGTKGRFYNHWQIEFGYKRQEVLDSISPFDDARGGWTFISREKFAGKGTVLIRGTHNNGKILETLANIETTFPENAVRVNLVDRKRGMNVGDAPWKPDVRIVDHRGVQIADAGHELATDNLALEIDNDARTVKSRAEGLANLTIRTSMGGIPAAEMTYGIVALPEILETRGRLFSLDQAAVLAIPRHGISLALAMIDPFNVEAYFHLCLNAERFLEHQKLKEGERVITLTPDGKKEITMTLHKLGKDASGAFVDADASLKVRPLSSLTQ